MTPSNTRCASAMFGARVFGFPCFVEHSDTDPLVFDSFVLAGLPREVGAVLTRAKALED